MRKDTWKGAKYLVKAMKDVSIAYPKTKLLIVGDGPEKPELEKIESKIIHNLWKEFPKKLKYPKPILIHKIEAEKTKQIFKSQK
mgnify:CR=1 FL=1